jgi:hypothetical protein
VHERNGQSGLRQQGQVVIAGPGPGDAANSCTHFSLAGGQRFGKDDRAANRWLLIQLPIQGPL